MKTKSILVLTFIMAATCMSIAQEGQKIQGTWKLIESSGNPLPEGYTNIKMITPTHFIWTMIDKEGNIVTGAAGIYTLEGNVYSETILYTLPGMQSWKGKNASYNAVVEGKVLKMSGSLTFDEKRKVGNEESWEKID